MAKLDLKQIVRQMLQNPVLLADIKCEAKCFLYAQFDQENQELYKVDRKEFERQRSIYAESKIREWIYFEKGVLTNNEKLKRRLEDIAKMLV